MKKLFCFLFTLLLPLACGAAEALPQLVKVDFPPIEYTAPENPTQSYPASKAHFSEDGLHYHDDSLDVQLHKISVYDTTATVAFVQIAHPDQLRTQQAKPYPSKTTARIDTIAKPVHSVFAVNADWFTYHSDGIVYRNGQLLRNRDMPQDDGLAIDINGDFHIVSPMTQAEYAKLAVPIAHSFAFGPTLVQNGQVQEIVGRRVTYRQRMALGQVDTLSYVFVAVEGTNEEDSGGVSMPQLAQLMADLGAHTAYNLDGGQSASMLMGNTKVNGEPKTMRAIGDIIYFTTALAPGE
ncbi:MAG: phosphodiester glycosidase family protein [Clostridia bacterium]|nr:phosphodiester glycosidase family protein [Clostridia bacterium]